MWQDVGSGLEHDDDDEWEQLDSTMLHHAIAERRIKVEHSTDGLNQRQSNEVSRQDNMA